jgi:tRNA(adenine34) deaminase
MGALIHARIERIVFGAPDPRAGACGSLIDFSDYPMESSPEIVGGVLAEDCIAPIRKFFNLNRKK